MTLKTRLCVSTSIAVLALFGCSEWLSFQQTSAFLAEHEALLRNADSATALAVLQAEKARLFRDLTAARLLYASLSVIASVILLNLLWYRMVLAPIQVLLWHINLMKRGTWTKPIPIRRNDEIGEIIQAYNDLGQELAFTVEQYSNASKLAALSLIGQRLIRKVKLAADHIASLTVLLTVAKEHDQPVPDAALRNLELAAKDLNSIEAEFEAQFERGAILAKAGPDTVPARP